ncbi:non-ribosomal peptide synthetase [Ketogulonicigenium vulgare]|uniref:Vicibactin biosynthesis non-ribosomal peptide synthase protein n=2 Tax=Ketogulonicigenium vulgare TaxID=92945 RepID=F9Y826_KETVW|nr:non-ribosomal peptide synthetase [Ketogulonicigenium vulgare]AEM41152.1 Vicibactin biosynthesis non-ribosomal peptide synthase protein [Ketogulonicigenium vulgare WSH-001]ALJ81290.1 non-ribosomal peptide synthetase [Ketogulonicigenium vulgare]ANW34028.1 non-ribosomal peptide synthetase [Ketogulonicigenium vulgare]
MTSTDRNLPLTTAQRGVWMGELLRAEGGTFNIAEAIEIAGPVDLAVFRAAILQVTAEAETTRLTIRTTPEGPVQRILPSYPGQIPFVDVSAAAAPDIAAQDWMMTRLVAPSDLANDVLWQAALLKLADDRFVWFHCAHHIVLDGASGGMLVARVAAIYTAMLEGRDAGPSPFLPLDTLIMAEAAYKTSKRREMDLAYWRDQLAAPPQPVTLSTKTARVRDMQLARQGFVAANRCFPADLTAEMAEVAKVHGASLPQFLTAALGSYIYRMTDQNDLCVGMPVMGRLDRAMRQVPGMAANAVVLRFAMAQDMPFTDMLAQVRRVMRGALKHQSFRYEDLRRALGYTQTQDHLSRMAINIEPFDYDLRFGPYGARNRNISNGIMEDLTIFVFDRQDGQGLDFGLYANPALYSQQALEAHLDRIFALTRAAITQPDAAMRDLPLLRPIEVAALQVDRHATAQERPLERLHTVMMRHARLSPSHLALTDLHGPVSRAALAQQVNALASALAMAGVCPGDVVALMLPRDRRQLIAMLAVAVTGATWLSLDADGPRDRNAAILQDAAPALVLTDDRMPHGLPAGLPVLGLDRSGEAIGLPYLQPRAPQVPPQSAYVIYTSGTTGRPKGVVVPWSSLDNLLRSMMETLDFGPDERWLSATSVTFDISILELLLPVLAGGHLVLAPRGAQSDPGALAQLITDHSITMMQATPTFWQMFLGAGQGDALAGLRLLCGGEPLSPPLAGRLLSHARALINVYGPTETTIWSSIHAVTAADCEATSIPAGLPLANTQFYILDSALNAVAPGMPGQLAIGGAGVATGYLGRPDLTETVFLPDHFTAAAGARIYLTGDRARRDADGRITILGRNDGQIKIRGVRAELSEIEGALLQVPGVAQAAVKLWPADQGTLLAAYLIPAEDSILTPDPGAIRAAVAGLLPQQLVPTRYMILDTLPVTAAGKLNRAALPEPEVIAAPAQQTIPTTPEEHALFDAWAEVLGHRNFGTQSSFFDLGGDSLAAVQVSFILSERGFRLPIPAFFGAPTIASLAPLMEGKGDALAMLQEIALPLRATGKGRPVFCLHPVLGLSVGFATLVPHLPADRPVYGLQDAGLMQNGMPPLDMQGLVQRYLARIRAIQPQGPYTLVGWSMGGLVAHAIASALEAAGDQVASLTLLDSYPIPLAEAQDDNWLMEQAIPLMGIDFPAGTPASLDMMADVLVQGFVADDPDLPVSPEDIALLIDLLKPVASRNLQLMRGWVPGHVKADVLFYRAAKRGSAPSRAEPALWQPHVGGKLTLRDLPASHMEMLRAAVAPTIAQGIVAQEQALTADPTPVAG